MFMPLLLLIFLLPSTLSRPPAIATSDVPTAYTPLPFPYLSLLGLFFAICGSNQAAEAAQRSISFAASLRASRLISRAAPLFPAMPAVPVRLLLLVPVRAKITVNVRPSPLRLQFLLAFNISSKLPAIKMRQQDSSRQTSYGSTSMGAIFKLTLYLSRRHTKSFLKLPQDLNVKLNVPLLQSQFSLLRLVVKSI
ncbi:hypothetical protein C8F04DRAFT_1193325 [Mycena alexandri]|uniref:Secreted protein n=1 Tax=Mycena alexandri TaxID=1745969 RepID=A0AAD6WSE1_9AGAR|nr:hypothetical protein C8F04DRAFT_1193325 [Mycena alexandri]